LIIEKIQGIKYPQCGEKKKKKKAMQPKEMKAQPEEKAKEDIDMRKTIRIITKV